MADKFGSGEMMTPKIKTLVDGFVTNLQEALEEAVQEAFQKRLNSFSQSLGQQPMARTHLIMKRPCPVKNCRNDGAPRYGMMCKEHKGLPDTKKMLLRREAAQPGGKWSAVLKEQNASKEKKSA